MHIFYFLLSYILFFRIFTIYLSSFRWNIMSTVAYNVITLKFHIIIHNKFNQTLLKLVEKNTYHKNANLHHGIRLLMYSIFNSWFFFNVRTVNVTNFWLTEVICCPSIQLFSRCDLVLQTNTFGVLFFSDFSSTFAGLSKHCDGDVAGYFDLMLDFHLVLDGKIHCEAYDGGPVTNTITIRISDNRSFVNLLCWCFNWNRNW